MERASLSQIRKLFKLMRANGYENPRTYYNPNVSDLNCPAIVTRSHYDYGIRPFNFFQAFFCWNDTDGITREIKRLEAEHD